MPVIITLIIAIFLILISWTWHNLGNIDKSKKIITIIITLIILSIITFIIFNISKSEIPYNSEEEMESVRNVLVFVFTLINGLITMPAIAKMLRRIDENDIEKDEASKKFILILVIFIIIIIFECGYLKNIQQEILNIYTKALQK